MSTQAHSVDIFTPNKEEMISAKEVITLIQQANVNNHLKEVVTNMLERIADGNSISIFSKNKEFTTSEAAEILHVSKTYLLKVIDRGDLPCRKIGSHRRIRAQDLYSYQALLETERTKSLTKLYQLSEAYEAGE